MYKGTEYMNTINVCLIPAKFFSFTVIERLEDLILLQISCWD